MTWSFLEAFLYEAVSMTEKTTRTVSTAERGP